MGPFLNRTKTTSKQQQKIFFLSHKKQINPLELKEMQITRRQQCELIISLRIEILNTNCWFDMLSILHSLLIIYSCNHIERMIFLMVVIREPWHIYRYKLELIKPHVFIPQQISSNCLITWVIQSTHALCSYLKTLAGKK